MTVILMLKPIVGLSLVGLVLSVAAFLSPQLQPAEDPDDLVTRQTARVAVLFWGIATAALLIRRRQFARAAWTVGCVTFLVHVATAFDRVHGWSHAAAVDHVETVSGFGPGLFFSYLFTTIWLADLGWWWLGPVSYDSRPILLDRVIYAFLGFMVFNGTVVYESGFIRWAGVVLFAVLGLMLIRRWSSHVQAGA